MTPTTLMMIGGIATVLSVIVLVFNFVGFFKSEDMFQCKFRSKISIHLMAGFAASGSILVTIGAFIWYIFENYIKNNI